MLRGAGVLMAALLILLPAMGFPIPGPHRRLVQWKRWPPERVVEYQHGSVVATKNHSYKTSLQVILDQSTQKRGSRNHKCTRIYLETPRKNAYRSHQQKFLLKDVILYKINPCKSTIQVSRKHLGTNELILRCENELEKISKTILKKVKLEGYEMKMSWHNIFHSIRKKPDNKKMKQLQIAYFENSHEYIGTRSSLTYIKKFSTHNILKVEEAHFKTSKLCLGRRLLQKQWQQGVRKQKENRKNNPETMLATIEERVFSKKSTNAASKDQHRMFLNARKTLNAERKDPHTGLKKYGLSIEMFQRTSNIFIREKIKRQNEKNRITKWVDENQKCAFMYAFTYQRRSDNLQKISVSKSQEKKCSIIKKWIRKHATELRTKKGSKPRRTKMEFSSKYYFKLSSIIDPSLSTISTVTAITHRLLSSEMYQEKLSLCEVEILKLLMQLSQEVKTYFSTAWKKLSISTRKAHTTTKHLYIEELWQTLLYLHKHNFEGLSVSPRTKRSTNGETVQVSVDLLKRLTSALTAGATIFGIILSALALAACYLYYKRRQIGQFLDVMLKSGESSNESESIDSQRYTPISVSQSFHFGHPQESSKNQTALATATEACSADESDFVTITEIYGSSDTEGSSNKSDKSLSVRSRAYLFTSWSSDSLGSLSDDICDYSSAQLSSSDEIILEKVFLNQSSTNAKDKISVPVAHQPDHYSCDNQERSSSSAVLQIKKPRISKSKSENYITSSSSKELHAVHSATFFYGVQNP